MLPLPSSGATLAHRYELGRVLGEGASSVVFEARDRTLHRDVAVKLLKPQGLTTGAAHRDRFLHEARTLAGLAHPHVVTTYDFSQTDEGVAFLVMELVTQGTLEAELGVRGALDVETTLRLLLPIMGALACAHDRGIVHRDLKPANIVLDRAASGATRAKLLDFGIAKVEHGNTTSGVILGTPAYMAPEQASAGTLGSFTDVWAMGVVLFRCLSARLPFEAPTPTGMLLKICGQRAPSIRSVCPSLGPHLALAIDRALEPERSARYASMRELARAIATACAHDGIALPDDPDPVGLPQFRAWLGEADTGATARLDEGPRTSSGVEAHSEPVAAAVGSLASSATPKPRKRSSTRLLLGAAALFGLVAVGALQGFSPAGIRAKPHVTAPTPEATPRPLPVASSPAPAASFGAPTQVARDPAAAKSLAPAPGPVPEDSAQPPAPATRKPRVRRTLTQAQAQNTSPEHAPPAAADEAAKLPRSRSLLIRDWTP